MRQIMVAVITALLIVVICLQVLAALNIFPRTKLVQICPVDAISMRNGKAMIDSSKCIGCKRCVIGVAAPLASSVTVEDPATTVKSNSETVEKVNAIPSANSDKVQPAKAATPNAQKTAAVSSPTAAVQTTYTVNPQTCIGCGLCTLYCPVQAITMVNNKAVIDPKKCINCGICKTGNGDDYQGCPVSAISAP